MVPDLCQSPNQPLHSLPYFMPSLRPTQAPEQQSRSLDLPAAADGEAAAEEGGGESSFSRRAFGGVAALAGMAFNVEQRVPDFEQAAKELVHPLFEALKVKVGMHGSV
jgi:hypothetical protein